MVELECWACGYYRDTPNHDLGCLPFHDTRDSECRARTDANVAVDGAYCTTCFPLGDIA